MGALKQLWLFSSMARNHSRQGPVFAKELSWYQKWVGCPHQQLLFIMDPGTVSKTVWKLQA